MRILVLGSGGREHAFCWKISQSKKVTKLYCAPGNAGTEEVAENVNIIADDTDKVKEFCIAEKIDLVVVGPELPLSKGITDILEEQNILVCGPSYAASRIESSKIFAKELMARYHVPTSNFRIFDQVEKAYEYIEEEGLPIVIKADGLAAGKGVFIPSTLNEAKDNLISILEDRVFGAAGNKVLIESFLEGEEVSVIVATDGENILPFVSSQDHKRIFDEDKGPNTGGMGAYSPAPVLDEETYDEVNITVLKPIIDGLREEGMPYKGFLYAGLMITEDGPKVLEFNVRFGDPETQVILPRLKTDIVEVLEGIAKKDINGMTFEWDERCCVSVVLVSGGYPGEYEKGIAIEGLEEAQKAGAIVFHAGTKKENNAIVTAGGRVLNITGLGDDIIEAIDTAYKGVEQIKFDGMFFRKDIAYRAVKRVKG